MAQVMEIYLAAADLHCTHTHTILSYNSVQRSRSSARSKFGEDVKGFTSFEGVSAEDDQSDFFAPPESLG